MSESSSDNYRVIRRVTLVGSVIDALLSVLKIAVGVIGQSQALIVDGIHSASDLATDLLVIWAARHAGEKPDERHPYGHQRIETLATMLLAVVLIVIALGFVYDAVLSLIDRNNLKQPGTLVLAAAGLSMLAKEGIYHYTLRAAKKINSRLLHANAWHSRSDAVSSLIVFIGAIGAMLGIEFADAVASVGVALMIGWVGWVLGREGFEELIDTNVETDTLAQMVKAISAVEGVIDVHQTRTRKMAHNIIMDTHITVNSRITVSEGHRIGDAVEYTLHQKFKDLSDITVHIDHEDDAFSRPGYHLPLRSKVLADISAALGTDEDTLSAVRLDSFTDIKLHYLEGCLQLEIWRAFPPDLSLIQQLDTEPAIRIALMKIDYISRVEFVYSRPTAAIK